jgi:hypothetical protein
VACSRVNFPITLIALVEYFGFLSAVQKYIKMYRTVVLYGCEPWSLTLRDEHRLRVFENRVLRKIFGPEKV